MIKLFCINGNLIYVCFPSIFRNVSIKLFAICIKTGPFYDNSFFKGDILDISRQTIMMVSDAEVAYNFYIVCISFNVLIIWFILRVISCLLASKYEIFYIIYYVQDGFTGK